MSTQSMLTPRTHGVWVGLLALALPLFYGCAVNPATGERQLSFMSEAQEIALGQQNDQQIVQQMGLYPDEGWQEYIQELGAELAAKSERPNLPWTFRVVDDPVVNAFALPGGYIYITRGILAHFNSEAELVSVLGHEIGHVTGRHGVERLSKAQLAQVGLGVATIAAGREYAGLAQMAGQGLGLLFLKFGRDDEREADDLGLRYLVRGGFAPDEMPKVFQTLDRVSAAAGSRLPGWLSTHPAPANRADRISEQIALLPPEQRQGEVDRNGYLARLNGITFGMNPREGYSVGNTFYHPDMAFALDFPEGWKIINQRQAVVGVSPEEDAVVVLTLAQADTPAADVNNFFSQEGITRGDAWRRNFYHFKAPRGQADAAGNQPEVWGLMGTVSHQGQLLRLLSYTADEKWNNRAAPMRQSLGSFRKLTQRKYLDVNPAAVKVVTLDRPMTLEAFHKRYPSNVELGELAILNGVQANETLPKGHRVKRIVGGELPNS